MSTLRPQAPTHHGIDDDLVHKAYCKAVQALINPPSTGNKQPLHCAPTLPLPPVVFLPTTAPLVQLSPFFLSLQMRTNIHSKYGALTSQHSALSVVLSCGA